MRKRASRIMPKKQTMYLETSVISAYFDFWKGNPAQKRETRSLWKVIPQYFNVYISNIVMIEIENAKYEEWKHQLQQLVRSIEKLMITDTIQKLAQEYTSNNVIPQRKILEFNQAHEFNTPIIIEPSELVKEL